MVEVKARYIAVYMLHGANKLSDGAGEKAIASDDSLGITASLNADPEKVLFHIDRSKAIAALLTRNFYQSREKGSPEEKLAAEVERIKSRRAKRSRDNLFLVFEAEAKVADPNFTIRHDTNNYAVCFDAIDKTQFREGFRVFVQNVLASLSLSLPANADRGIEEIGNAVYLVDPENGKPIYTFKAEVGPVRVSVASSVSEGCISKVAVLTDRLASQGDMDRPTSLLITSLDSATGELQAFIAAWSALEIFVNATFRTTYNARWFCIMEEGAPNAAKPIFERLKEVMRDKYRLAEKFLIMASVLDPETATEDQSEFLRVKKVRDGLFHILDMPSSPLPTEAIQNLLLKYMKLHLDNQV